MIENRISRHTMYMEMAQAASKRSTCFRRNVGAIITVNDRPVSVGYNGPASGEPHCSGKDCVPAGVVGCQRSIHAEVNAILYVPDSVISQPKILYVTESPCLVCAARLVQPDVRLLAVYYLNEYRDASGIDHLLSNEVQVYRMTPSGYVVDRATGQLVE